MNNTERAEYTPTTHTMRTVYINAMMQACDHEDHLRAKHRREVADEFDRWLDAERDAAQRGAWRDGYVAAASVYRQEVTL